MLHVGDMAPDFDVLTDEGTRLKLSDLRGKTVILYFYPKSDTPGCTKEAYSFRDAFPRFNTDRAVVLGISPDDVKAQAKFKAKYNLPFTLLADADHAIAEAYGVWGEKSMYGKTYWGVSRETFIIGPDGKIERVFEKVKPEGHAEEVLQALQPT